MSYRCVLLFPVLIILSGCIESRNEPYNELNTFLSGDAEYIGRLQNQLLLEPQNEELREKLKVQE